MRVSPHLADLPDIDAFHREGFLRLELTDTALQLIIDLVAVGREMFRRSEADKRGDSLQDIHEGWQPFGGEFSISPERPDLHESFWVTRRHAAIAASTYSALAASLHSKMLAYLDVIQNIEGVILNDLLTSYGVDAALCLPAARSQESDLQLLYYQPNRHSRSLLQDPHEDSLSLTFTWADGAGLELLHGDGRYHPIDTQANQITVLPGEIIALLSGYRILPQIHRVVRHPEQAERLTLSYFSAPDLASVSEIRPWIECPANSGISIADRIRANRIKYLVS